jgi:hypothetical protein
VSVFLSTLTDAERAEVAEAFADPLAGSTALRGEMVNRGWNPPKAQTIQRHRRGECRCD